MRRTSVMIEVSDDVYDSIVDPLKRNKSFAKLISSLLNGYLSDGYIRAFVDDGLEEVRKAVVGSFEDSVSNMEATLANMGLLADELGSHAQAGYSKFQQRKTEQAEELDKDPTFSYPNGKKAEVEELRSQVSDLERFMRDGFNQILSLLNTRGVEVPASTTTPVETQAKSIINSSSLSVTKSQPVVPTATESRASTVDVFADDKAESEEGQGGFDATDMVNNLLASMGY